MPEAFEVFAGPAVTALGLAAARAVESGRPDRLIDDPLARCLYTAADADLPMLLDWPAAGSSVPPVQALHLHGSRYIGLRTRFYDDVLLAGAADGHRQAVLLGAGLDTRAYRLQLPARLRLYEVDQPALLGWKRGVLARQQAVPRCHLRDVGIDLRDDWPAALTEAGFDRTLPTSFIAEGLLAYLRPAEQARLLEDINDLAAPATRLALDQLVDDPHAGDRLESLTRRSGINMNDLIAHGGSIDTAELLSRLEWDARHEPVATVARHYRRDLSDPFSQATSGPASEPPWLQTSFLTAEKRLP